MMCLTHSAAHCVARVFQQLNAYGAGPVVLGWDVDERSRFLRVDLRIEISLLDDNQTGLRSVWRQNIHTGWWLPTRVMAKRMTVRNASDGLAGGKELVLLLSMHFI